MPEGHTVHRIARQFRADLVDHPVAVSSPQGRFAAGAALLDGSVLTTAAALGKHLLLGFGYGDDAPLPVSDVVPERWVHVHLGLYGAWDFRGRVSPLADGEPVAFLGAPRRAVRMGEGEASLATAAAGDAGVLTEVFPPPPVGAVRVRLATDATVADLRGPTACEVLGPPEVAAIVAKAGPDPQVDAWPEPQAEFVRRVRRRRVAIGQLLMDQSVVSGIGNIYRAEMLFRARLEPHVPGSAVPEEVLDALWRDWVVLLEDGIRTGVMLTREDLDGPGAPSRAAAVADRSLRHAVYGRAGEPCLRCGSTILREELAGRTLYWCPACQS
ncbi:Fpg/Nei family DNA glycosylase [Actinotalea sp. JY-7876]|uniref:Fpg/Nei family DNA glycosylase n=1 Tax=Actinotalea sp. JY-7876 TaxID=2758442 RepID=UPI0015F6CF76|nr:zinc finger domain-containing protein [Actinotalea sp. JY-7876]